jgi:hypothetical protein
MWTQNLDSKGTLVSAYFCGRSFLLKVELDSGDQCSTIDLKFSKDRYNQSLSVAKSLLMHSKL